MKRSDYYFILLAVYLTPKMPDTPAMMLATFYLVFAMWNWIKESRKGAVK